MLVPGSVSFITGGASGLGQATAAALVGLGGNVVLFDRDEAGGSDAARRLGERASFVQGDVADPSDVEAALDSAVGRFGRLDVTVNCAGVAPLAGVLDADDEPHPLELFRLAVDVNLIGLFDVVRQSARLMSRNEPRSDGERGVIVNVASIAGLDSPAGQPAYVATKAAVAAMTLALARDLAPRGIRVMAIAPGMMDTPMLGSASQAAREALTAQIVFPRRLGYPAEFADLVCTVVQTPMLNGETIRLDAATHL